MHAEQLEEPGAAANFDAGHGPEQSADKRDSESPKRPAAQEVHRDAPPSLKRPAGHAKHAVAAEPVL